MRLALKVYRYLFMAESVSDFKLSISIEILSFSYLFIFFWAKSWFLKDFIYIYSLATLVYKSFFEFYKVMFY